MKHARLTALSVASLALVLLSTLATGCGEEPTIQRYQALKPEVLEVEYGLDKPRNATTRMIVAIVPRAGQAWFFKLLGPLEAVAAEQDHFESLIRSLEFAAAEAPPAWKLPAGWVELPGNQFRHATLKTGPDAEALEISVSQMHWPTGEEAAQRLVANINRWREQLSLPPLTTETLERDVRQMRAGEQRVTLVDFIGAEPKDDRSSGMGIDRMAGPFSGPASPVPRAADPPLADPVQPGPAQAAQQRISPEAKDASLPFEITVPELWQRAPLDMSSKLAYQLEQDGQRLRMTVSSLGLGAANLAANVNRWRDQIGLPVLPAEEIEQQCTVLQLGSVQGKYAVLRNEAQGATGAATLGVIAPHGEAIWFFKLTGDAPLVEQQQHNFETMLRSVRF